MKISEITEAIKIGFEKPKYYKRSVWNKSVKVMEFLVCHTVGQIEKTYLGNGLEKYRPLVEVTDSKLNEWAEMYVKRNSPTFMEAADELEGIAETLGVRPNRLSVLDVYFN